VYRKGGNDQRIITAQIGYNGAAMAETIDSPYIHAATADNFRTLVLENSRAGPVLVNFWSRKAGPCLRQYPVLDKLIHDYDGRVLLVNIDAEHEVIIPKEYGVASVPTLKLFRHERAVETWRGYQSEDDLRKVLDRYVVRDSDKTLADAVQLYVEGQPAKAYAMIADAVIADPVNPRLPLAVCKLLKHEQRYEEALQLIDALPDEQRNHPEIVQLHALFGFYDIYQIFPKDVLVFGKIFCNIGRYVR